MILEFLFDKILLISVLFSSLAPSPADSCCSCALLTILVPPPAPLLSPAAHSRRSYKWNQMIGTKTFFYFARNYE